ncbi:MAG: MmgE/PrpD family protein, partial [Syntrophales bacterium]|nr:MmgE/PrpD family protein [Syntrophales bacterium]
HEGGHSQHLSIWRITHYLTKLETNSLSDRDLHIWIRISPMTIDMGDVHEKGSHITEWIVPTLLSVLGIAGKKITGRDFIAAYIVAAELGIRTPACYNASAHSAGMPGEYNGPLYCAAAASRLLGSNVDQTWNALGIAYSTHSMSETQKYAEGTQMARLQHSFAADTGIKATLLAQRGVTGPKGIYLGVPGGSLRHIEWSDDPLFDPNILTNDLGKKWVYSDGLSMKPYSSCKFTHSFISAILTLMSKNQIDYRQITGIHCIGSEGSRLTIEPMEAKWNPSTVAEAMFSTPYTVSTAAITGNVFLDSYTDAELKRSDKRELMKKVTFNADPGIKTPFDGFTVEVTLQNGQKYSETNQYVLGHTKNPMSWDDLKEKFWNCVPYSAVPLPKKKFQAAADLCANLDEAKDMGDMVKALTP